MSDIDREPAALAISLGLERLQHLDPALFRQTLERVRSAVAAPVPPTTEPAHVFVAAPRS